MGRTACFALSLNGIKAETERRRFHSTTKRGCENTPGLGFNPRRVFHKHHEDRRGPLTWGTPKCHQDPDCLSVVCILIHTTHITHQEKIHTSPNLPTAYFYVCDIRELLATLDTGAELLATLDTGAYDQKRYVH